VDYPPQNGGAKGAVSIHVSHWHFCLDARVPGNLYHVGYVIQARKLHTQALEGRHMWESVTAGLIYGAFRIVRPKYCDVDQYPSYIGCRFYPLPINHVSAQVLHQERSLLVASA